jgi:glycosyltransferase involved in cell wall biosynthesis
MRDRVYLVLEAAKINSGVQYHLLYRQWATGYTNLVATKEWLDSQPLSNVALTNHVVSDMNRFYREYDFTVIPYTTAEGGKECPTSAVEGLACGLPTLISLVTSFADFVAEYNGGVIFDPSPASVAEDFFSLPRF